MVEIQVVTPDQEIDATTWTAIQRFRRQLDQWDYQCNKFIFSGYPELEALQEDIRHPKTIEWIDKSRIRYGRIYLLAYDDTDVVGYAVISTHDSYPVSYWRFMSMPLPKVMTLDQICVDESVRDAGIGSKLMHAAKQYAKSQGHRDMILGYMSGNRDAERFYQKHKFHNVERFYVLRKPSGRPPHTPWIWGEVDGSSKIHLQKLTPMVRKYVADDRSIFPPLRFVESTITDKILHEIKNKKLHVYGCNGGKDGYFLCNTTDSMFDIYFIFFPEVMWKRPRDVNEAVRSIPACCPREKWLTISVIQEKLDRALSMSGYQLYSSMMTCKL